MTIEEKSIIALREFLKAIDKDTLTSMVEEIDNLKFEGPTVYEYLNNFEYQYGKVYSSEYDDYIDCEVECVTISDHPPQKINSPKKYDPEFLGVFY